MNLTAAIHTRLAGDATLTGLLSTYEGEPSIFTTDPAPEGASLPYLVTAGNVADKARDTKTTRGREVWRDVRCYTSDAGGAVLVEQIAERVRALLHRHELAVTDHQTIVAEASGPIAADEDDAYGRIVNVRFIIEEV
ncbi:MAG: DUF3168 domain-containing protein [Pseudomonadota bacterium]